MIHHLSVVLAILFGSMAKNHAVNDRDLEIAVSMSTPLTVKARLTLMEDLALAFCCPIDLIDLNQAHNPLLQQILTSAIIP